MLKQSYKVFAELSYPRALLLFFFILGLCSTSWLGMSKDQGFPLREKGMQKDNRQVIPIQMIQLSVDKIEQKK